MTTTAAPDYAARLTIDYPNRSLDRLSTFLRIFYVIPILIVFSFVTGSQGPVLFFAVLLLLVFRHKYPRWWFDFILQVSRFSTRVFAYLALMSDTYPSTDEEQFVHLDLDYPNAKQDLSRRLPLVKWLLAIPHLVLLVFLGIGAILAAIVAWFAVLFTGRYPRPIFDYIEGVMRWALRVEAYAVLLITDEYPPFRLT
ncbi:MAG: DUF4389 domain-containing protein [Acidobacteria bacterium]|nr:DUF4389 domain-containing protein [Acidobacteriota bacterium]